VWFHWRLLKGILMSTTTAVGIVKQCLLDKVEHCCQQMRQLAERLPNALVELADAEQLIRQGMLAVGRELLQGWSEAADAHVAAPHCEECQEAMRHKGYVESPLVTTLGDLRIRRARFRCEYCHQECYPHDARTRFLGHAVSWPLAKVIGRLGAQLPFEQSRQSLLTDYGVRISKHTLQTICEEAGLAVLEREDAERQCLTALPPAEQLQALPDSEISPETAYVFGDGTMLHTEGDWHEIRVASVAAYDSEDRRLALHHRARFLSCEDFGWQLLLLSRQAGYHRAKLRAFIGDGARWLWELAALHFSDAVQILDWYHLSEHIHEAAAVLYRQGSDEAKRFSEARLDELWEGRHICTLNELRLLRKQMRASVKRECLRKLITYLENNRQRIDYPRYRRLGLRIGSGQVEGACKSLVGARCKQAGMRNWTRRGAEGVLRLRAALQTGEYDALWQASETTAA
jgi:hypothetical protein